MAVYHPPVLWAQRKEKLFVTIDVQDCANPKLKFAASTEGSGGVSFLFTGVRGDDTNIDVSLVLYGEINKDDVKVSVTGRHVLLVIPKTSGDFWPRLTKGKQPRNVTVDWSKWVDEDEENPAPEFDMSSLGNLGGMDQFGDSDDDDEEEEMDTVPTKDDPESQDKIEDGEQKLETNGTVSNE